MKTKTVDTQAKKRGRKSRIISFPSNQVFTVESIVNNINRRAKDDTKKQITSVTVGNHIKKLLATGAAYIDGKRVRGAGRPLNLFKLGHKPANHVERVVDAHGKTLVAA